MRLLKRSLSAITRNSRLGMLLLAFAGACSAALGQTAPYVLPYTMSTFAGPHAVYTAGTACGPYLALDAAGDGCLASVASIGADPHDIRVDGQGNIYWLDNNGSTGLMHKISAVTGRMTVYVGSTVISTECTAASTTQGDGCVSTDGAANAGITKNPLTVTYPSYTAKMAKSRGLAVGINGDVFYADYNGDYDHKISAATGIMSVVAGNGAANAANPPTPGQPGSSQVNGSRGIGVDPNGNVYIADTGDGVLRVVPSGIGSVPGVASPVAGYAYTLTIYNPSTINTKTVATGIPVAQTTLNAPEDVQCDSNGNVYIADAGNSVVRVLYAGKGTIPGVANPVSGYVYVIAGYSSQYSPAQNTYPTDGTTPTFPATNVTLSDRKIALDTRNNLYIADSSYNVVWFVDNTTGNIRLLAGRLGLTAGAAAPGCTGQTDVMGDGCPGTFASLYSASDMGVGPDNQGNIYITDAQGGVVGNARLRKLLSGLNFPAVAKGASVTQTLLLHFAAGDSPAAVTPFAIKGAGTAYTDYVAGNPTCTTQTDTTTDCTLPITFTPTQPGNDTATLSIKSTLGGANSYLLTGTGTLAAVTIDPGSVSVLNTTINNAQGVAVDGAGNVYTADTGNNRVLLYTASTGVTSTFAGTGTSGYTGDTGLATLATLKAPRAVTIDAAGSIYIADTGNNVIRKVNAAGIISTFAGAGTACTQAINTRGDGCPATQATLSAPAGIAADNLGGIYIADTGNNVIREVSVLGNIATIAGGATSVCTAAIDVFGDGCNGTASVFKSPSGIAFDATGSNIIVADTGNNIVRKVFLANTISSAQGATYITSTVAFNPVTLIAGTGAPGNVIDTNSTGVLSQLSGPTGVAISPSGAVYIADTGNSAVRVVSPAGAISTIVGVLGAAGTDTVPGSAASVQLTSPSAVAVTPTGTLQIADAGNNRLLTDLRSQITFNFGRTNEGFASPTQNFIESNVGVIAATLPSPLLTQSTPTQTQFTLGPVSGSTGCAPGAFALGATCVLQGQFTPANTGTFTDTYTEVGSNVAAGDPSITLVGTGAILTKTTSVVAQTAPTGNSQFGATATVTATITPASCNTAAPACYPTGSVRFIIDGGNPGAPIAINGSAATGTSAGSLVIAGLAVGPHTIACNYSGDNFYAASTCGTVTITVVQGGTTSVLTVTNNNQTQFDNCTGTLTNGVVVGSCGVTVLTATVTSNTIATAFPTGNVTFSAGTTVLGSSPVNATNGVASFTLQEVIGTDGNAISNNTLPPGTYTLNCTYNGSPNFAVSNCTGVTFTVLPSPTSLTLTGRGCQLSSIVVNGTSNPSLAVPCAITNYASSGAVQVDTAQGSTTDASIFLRPSNTFSGTVTFTCSGLPNAGACTFLPSSITFVAGTNPAVPQATDMTLWTDVPAGTNVTSIRTERNDGIAFAVMLGWPLTLAGFAGVIRFRRKLGHGILSIIAFALLLAGSSILTAGCAGPGVQPPNLTPAGTYPIVVTATGGGITSTTTVSFVVGAPGIPGQE